MTLPGEFFQILPGRITMRITGMGKSEVLGGRGEIYKAKSYKYTSKIYCHIKISIKYLHFK